MPTYETTRLFNTVLNLYYMEELTQSKIAKRLGLSTAKVNRLLQQARELGYVNITIRTPFQQLFDLETRLKAVFGIQEAIVIPSMADAGSLTLNALGAAAAEFFLERLHDGDIVAITPGTTIQATVQAIDTTRSYSKVQVVPMLGAIQGQIESDMNYLATNMGEKLNAKAYQLHAPVFADTKAHGDALRSMVQVKDILDIARHANVALLGVGTVDPDVSRFVQFTALSADDMKNIAEVCGGVGEICAQVYNIEGQPCGQEYADRIIGLTLAEIQNIPFRIGIAASAAKALPIYGALRGGYLHALITDEAAACGVLELFDENFRRKS